MSQAIHDASDPLVVMRRVVEEALVLVAKADGAAVELVDDGRLTYVCTSGSLAGHVGTQSRMEQSLSGLAIGTGETLYCEDAACDPRVDREACLRVGAVSMVCVPLHRGSDPIGALRLTARQPSAFTGEDVAVLARLAEFISALIGAVSDLSRSASALFDAGMLQPRHEGEDESCLDRRSTRRGVSEFVANVLQPGAARDEAVKRRIEQVIAQRTISMRCQPIVDLHTGALAGVEALARFPGPPDRPPNHWFAQAEQVGLGVELQLAAVEVALPLIEQLPCGVYLAINLGPDALMSAELPPLLRLVPSERVVLELTEHLAVDDYPSLIATLQCLRSGGVRLAIDDAGAGFASLSHIVKLAPDLIKLDRRFTAGIDLDPVRRALAQALVTFAHETGAQVTAEGIETDQELETVRSLGIPYGQGYFIARPEPVELLQRNHAHIAEPHRAG